MNGCIKNLHGLIFATSIFTVGCGQLDPASVESKDSRRSDWLATSDDANSSNKNKESSQNKNSENGTKEDPSSTPSCSLTADTAAAKIGDVIKIFIQTKGIPTSLTINGTSLSPELLQTNAKISGAGSQFFEGEVSNKHGSAKCLLMVIGVNP
jgi:hypothetical protein